MPSEEDPEGWKLLLWLRRLDWALIGIVVLGLALVALMLGGVYLIGRELLHHHWTQDDLAPWMIGSLVGVFYGFYGSRILLRRNCMQSIGTVSLRFSPTDRLMNLSRDPAGRPSWFREFSGPDGFWNALRSLPRQAYVAGRLDGPGELPQTNEECERRVRLEFGELLSRGFARWPRFEESKERDSIKERDSLGESEGELEAWRSIRFTVTSVRYHSLSLGLLFVGAKEVFRAIDEKPDVFAELFHALAPHALDEALGANVSNWLDLDVTIRGRARRRGLAKHVEEQSASPSPSVLLVRYFAPLLPILLGLALVFVVAYNTYDESRKDINATKKREDFLLERQEKLLEAQNTRIGALESKLGVLLILPGKPTSEAPSASGASSSPAPEPRKP
jgi:hypothetical protein